MNKKLGLDLGTVRIGIATSDMLGMFASPYENYNCVNEQQDLIHIAEIVKKFNIDEIIVGLPLNMDGTEGKMVVYVRDFCNKLSTLVDAKIIFRDERLTSCQAEDILIERNYRREKRKQMLDALSASLILQSYLDEKKY